MSFDLQKKSFYATNQYVNNLDLSGVAIVANWLGRLTHDSRVVGSIPTLNMVRF